MGTTATAVVDFVMPSLGADMTEGRITEWLVGPGDRAERGQAVVVVETDKSDIEVEVFEACTFVELLVPEGTSVSVGTPIARIEPAGRRSKPGRTPPPAPAEPVAARPVPSVGSSAARITSPVIRHLAEQLHVDPEHLRATGSGGRVHREDVELAAAPRVPSAPLSRRDRRVTPRARRLIRSNGLDPEGFDVQAVVTGDMVLAAIAARRTAPPTADRAAAMRRHIAGLMARSWAEIPHFHVTKRLDLTATVRRLTQRNEGVPLTDRAVPGAALMCAVARAARQEPSCNGWWRDDHFVAADHVHLGVVLSLRSGGIVVPTIQDADALDVGDMMRRLGDLVQRARSGRLRASDVADATITVTYLGDRGAESVTGIIQPPQVALVGFGVVHDEVWAVDGRPVVRPTAIASLAGDHRAIDGLTGSRLLVRVQSALDDDAEEVPT